MCASDNTPAPQKIHVAVIGGSGYTGAELVRLLLQHPHAQLTAVTAKRHTHQKVGNLFPPLTGKTDLIYEPLNVYKIGRHNQVVFLCLPHGQSMNVAFKFRQLGLKVIDLSANFRFQNIKLYEKIYGRHTQKKLLGESAYGLPEIFKQQIKKSRLTAVPGCYVTSVILALAPLLQNQMILPNFIICDCKSGTSGAGRAAASDKIFAEVHDNFKAYGIANHRHRHEIEEKLSFLAGKNLKATFTPHLLPLSRGILSTIYTQPLKRWSNKYFITVYKKFYRNSPFVKILEDGNSAQIKGVVGSNDCHISLHFDAHSEKLIILSALDNLVKGASGQAVQCFNLMCGFEETEGLGQIGVYP